MKILSADDSAMMRRIIRGAVEVLGYDFIEAVDGIDAMKKVEANFTDLNLILLDWNMPGMDGFSVLKKIKEDPRFNAIPVAMITTESEKEKIAEAIRHGAINYITKPFSQEDLCTKIVECLGIDF
jgi:two-component system, chemotaxis family, chemotaxis protein CheY